MQVASFAQDKPGLPLTIPDKRLSLQEPWIVLVLGTDKVAIEIHLLTADTTETRQSLICRKVADLEIIFTARFAPVTLTVAFLTS